MPSNKVQLLQDPFLNMLRKEHIPVSIYLVNGIKLQGPVRRYFAQHLDADGLQARHQHRCAFARRLDDCSACRRRNGELICQNFSWMKRTRRKPRVRF